MPTPDSRCYFKSMTKFRLLFKQYRWAILSALLLGSSYIPLPPWALFFCWVPIWRDVIEEKSLKRIFLKGWVLQVIAISIGFHWIAYTVAEFGNFSWIFALAALCLYSTTVYLYFPLAMVAGVWLGRKTQMPLGWQFATIASFHVVGEIFWPAIFPFNLGYPLYYVKMPIAQTADVIGVAGLSWLVYLLNAQIAWLSHRKERVAARVLAFSLLGFLLLNLWGWQKKAQWEGGDRTLHILQVQANIGNFEKVQATKGYAFQSEILSQFFALTQEGLAQHPETELVVWPETAFPDYLGAHNAGRPYTRQLIEFARTIKRPILTGGFGNDPPDHFPRRQYNSLFLYDENGNAVAPYYFKTYLLIFGEYTPLGRQFPALIKLNPAGEGWGWGSGPLVMSHRNLRFGPQICYEGVYPEFSRALARQGAQIFVNATNDSWFGSPFEPMQHLMVTMARAVENRRPLIRSTNTGITSVALADGTILQESPTHESWQGAFAVPYRENPELTFYTKYGGLLPLVVGAFILLACFAKRASKTKSLAGRIRVGKHRPPIRK
ncbi:MAG: apolipoprotein N-acyltransferase [Bdellovibrio sp.]|nr:MAG: apolipoprotein N-acyltransferase [Bdellovibrio sp.]